MCAIAWHDISNMRAVSPTSSYDRRAALLSTIGRWMAAAVACALLGSATGGVELRLTGGSQLQLTGATIASALASGAAACLNGVAGAVVAVAGFFLTDAFVRLAHVL
eukprot:4372932-Prymnesium_polylepis.1